MISRTQVETIIIIVRSQPVEANVRAPLQPRSFSSADEDEAEGELVRLSSVQAAKADIMRVLLTVLVVSRKSNGQVAYEAPIATAPDVD